MAVQHVLSGLDGTVQGKKTLFSQCISRLKFLLAVVLTESNENSTWLVWLSCSNQFILVSDWIPFTLWPTVGDYKWLCSVKTCWVVPIFQIVSILIVPLFCNWDLSRAWPEMPPYCGFLQRCSCPCCDGPKNWPQVDTLLPWKDRKNKIAKLFFPELLSKILNNK